MMMISSRQSAAAARTRRIQLFWLAALALLLGLAAFWREPLSSLFWQAAGPLVQSRLAGTPAEVQLASTTALLADRDVLYAENLELKSRLGRPGVAPRRILAGVMLRPPATPYDSLVIDAGAAEGVVEGDIVSAGGTVVVGSISEVYEHMARVTLYSAPGNEYEALLNGTLPTTLSGQGGGSLVAQVPAGTTVAEGDTAVLPGITGGLVAKVRGIERGTGESFVTLYFSLAVDALNLRYVEVWKQ